MNIGDIAQIVTGIATLIVAVVLLFQIRIQQKNLEVLHRDAERDLSLRSWQMLIDDAHLIIKNDEFRKIYDKRHKGFKSLSSSEKSALENYFMVWLGRINTDYRLGRLGQEEYYYKMHFEKLMDSKAGIEFYETIGRDIFKNTPKKNRESHIKFLQGVGDTVYKQVTGKKFKK